MVESEVEEDAGMQQVFIFLRQHFRSIELFEKNFSDRHTHKLFINQLFFVFRDI